MKRICTVAVLALLFVSVMIMSVFSANFYAVDGENEDVEYVDEEAEEKDEEVLLHGGAVGMGMSGTVDEGKIVQKGGNRDGGRHKKSRFRLFFPCWLVE